jgi:hypothetical protein
VIVITISTTIGSNTAKEVQVLTIMHQFLEHQHVSATGRRGKSAVQMVLGDENVRSLTEYQRKNITFFEQFMIFVSNRTIKKSLIF